MPAFSIGIIAEERRQWDEAERWYRQSLVIRERIGDARGQAQTLHQLGRIAEKQGNTTEAIALSRMMIAWSRSAEGKRLR